jgi:Zn-dependent peptidase ImmA (M78 family)
MSLRRGFKAEAERIAAEIRSELSLNSTSRLDPHSLAAHLEIPVLKIRDCARFTENGGSLRYLTHVDPDSFSAITVFIGTRRYIIYNESHAPTRQANDIVHEIAHCLLEHPPSPVTDHSGCRHWDKTLEDEANWLAGALLVPRQGALALARSGMAIADIAANFGVSEQLCRWRIYQTGVAHQLRAGSRWSCSSRRAL